MAGVLHQGHRWLQPECLSLSVCGKDHRRNFEGRVANQGLELEQQTVGPKCFLSSPRYSEMNSTTHVPSLHTQICPHEHAEHTHRHTPTHPHTHGTARVSAGMTDAVRTVVCSAVKERPEGLCCLTVHQGSAVTQ